MRLPDEIRRTRFPADHRIDGVDDWEWGVTLWSRARTHQGNRLHHAIDKASAGYAEFGPFYVSYIMGAPRSSGACQSLKHVLLL